MKKRDSLPNKFVEVVLMAALLMVTGMEFAVKQSSRKSLDLHQAQFGL